MRTRYSHFACNYEMNYLKYDVTLSVKWLKVSLAAFAFSISLLRSSWSGIIVGKWAKLHTTAFPELGLQNCAHFHTIFCGFWRFDIVSSLGIVDNVISSVYEFMCTSKKVHTSQRLRQSQCSATRIEQQMQSYLEKCAKSEWKIQRKVSSFSSRWKTWQTKESATSKALYTTHTDVTSEQHDCLIFVQSCFRLN